MPIIGSFSYGSASAVEYSTVQELLSQLPDNTDNIIVAQDIRDAVYTLWEKADSGLTSSVYFQSQNPVPLSVGGITANSTFPNPTDMQTMWEKLLYPYFPPSCSLNPDYLLEYGNPNGLIANSLNLNWTVTKNSEDITSIVVAGQTIIPTGNSQFGTVSVSGTHSSTPGSIETNTFSIFVTDGIQSNTDISTITWMNRIYWGSIDLGGINLTTNPQLITQAALLCDDNSILNLDGAGVGTGSELSTSKNRSYNGINGNGEHLIFAWPSSLIGSLTPTFILNGMPTGSFTRVRTASAFTNQYGFTIDYEVWVSNTLQNSPITLFDII